MPFETFGNDIFAIHGCGLLSSFPRTDSIPRLRSSSAHPSARSTSLRASSQSTLPAEPVGILGAGASGLYAALILDDLGIPYEIIEARDRVGGRLYTHKFPNSTGAPFNYFDVGAMRFPDIPAMRRVFHLFHYSPLNTSGINLEGKLKPYYFRGAANNDTLMSHNGVTVKQNAIPTGDPFQGAAVIQDIDPQPYLRVGAKAIADDVIEPFAIRLLEDLAKPGTNKGWEYLKKYDHYSTRAYMSLEYRPSAKLNLPDTSLPSDVINWVETFDRSTGWYDRALSETVLEAIAFGWSPSTNPMEATKWWGIDGGAYQIADCMAKYIRSRKRDAIVLNKRVTGIGLADDQTAIEVVTDGVDRQRFSHVISSIPLPVMRTIDLTKAGLTPMQSGALRQLNYGPSTKIGMQFRTAWWTTGSDKDGKPLNIIGGQSYTDTPLRTVVYPSFGEVKAGKTTTLIASYCWTEDAERLGALIGNGDQILVELVLRELASIHNVTVDFLQGEFIDMFAWNWSQDPYTMGAFAFFGPGKFANAFKSLNMPAARGRLHFAGEAISVRHAWVEGALTSAWRSVFELLTFDEAFEKSYLERFFQNWGVNAEFFENGLKALPHDAQSIFATMPSESRRSERSGDLPTEHLLQAKALPRDAQHIFGTMPSESRRSEPSGDPTTERVELENLLRGSLLINAIAVTHKELVDK